MISDRVSPPALPFLALVTSNNRTIVNTITVYSSAHCTH